ncbi:MAG: DsbE family thiol:disulfide interchange protein [Rudaea sp.]|uniref:DsbE family thiol:disulfide interchange protein n=1 Tax=Rudaea sp. TaxID=2136325 RepID=UPI0039E23A47
MNRLLPLLGFFALVGLLGFGIWWNTHHETNEVPSPLIGKSAPEFVLPLLYDPAKTLSKKELLGKPYLVNVFGSWCVTCQYEHPILTEKVKPLGIKLIGMAWKDQPEDAKRWLAQFGDPYDAVVSDVDGRTGIDFGVYMAPESFLVDAQGTIRYKRIGMFTPELIESELLPEMAKLQQARP